MKRCFLFLAVLIFLNQAAAAQRPPQQVQDDTLTPVYGGPGAPLAGAPAGALSIMIGTAKRTLAAKLNDFGVNIMDTGGMRYGIDAGYSDAANDTAIQTALNTIQAAGGGTLTLPCGIFGTTIAGFTYTGSGLVIRGSGLCTQIVKNSLTSTLFTFSGNNYQFADFFVSTSGQDTAGTLFNIISGGNNVIVSNVLTNGGYDILTLPAGAAQTMLDNDIFDNYTHNGVHAMPAYGGGLFASNLQMIVRGDGLGLPSAYVNHGTGMWVEGGDTIDLENTSITGANVSFLASTKAIASCTGSVTGVIMTITACSSGTLLPYGSSTIIGGAGITYATSIAAQISGVTGGAGTYQLTNSMTVALTTITEYTVVRNITATNSAADGVGMATGNSGWKFDSTAGGEISWVQLTAVSGSTMPGDGFEVAGANYFSCVDCMARANQHHGFDFHGSPNPAFVTIADSIAAANSIGNCGNYDGIHVEDYTTRVRIHDTISGIVTPTANPALGTPCQRYGINMVGTHSDHFDIHDNDTGGNVVGGILNGFGTTDALHIMHDNM